MFFWKNYYNKNYKGSSYINESIMFYIYSIYIKKRIDRL